MAELPIMPLKTDALLADTMHMSAEEFGVYCRLLFVMWRHGGKLHDSDSEMAAIGGIPAKRWLAIKEKVMRPMTAIGGLVSQKRLTDTWMNVQEVRRKKALAADIRWNGKPRPPAMHVHDHKESRRNANQSQKNKPSFSIERDSGAPSMHEDEPEEGLAGKKTRFRLSGEALTAIGSSK